MISRSRIEQIVLTADAKGYRPVMVTTPEDVTEIGTRSPLSDVFTAFHGQPYGVILFRDQLGEIYEVSIDEAGASESSNGY